MNAECRELRPLLSAYMDNELTASELRAVQAHIDTCAECAVVLAEYRQVRSAMRSLAQPVPPAELRAAVFAKATPAYRCRAAVLTVGQRGLWYAALAAAAIAIFLTSALLLRGGVVPGKATVDTTPPSIVSFNRNRTSPPSALEQSYQYYLQRGNGPALRAGGVEHHTTPH